ncbi:MAG TPA: hypothetical protein VLE43_21585 [Candidatus Saccharimonadia bacterium]|nr:hypothetical protein [Candidatus Saccharimonadia bacterium]
MSDLTFQVLTEKEVSILEDTPHNPPTFTESFTVEDFDNEWWSVHERLASCLESLGSPCTVENDGDFMLPEKRGKDRWIYITFCSTRFWRPEFVTAVADLLRHTSQDYRVACLTELTDAADPNFQEPLVYLVISATSVAGLAGFPQFNGDGTVTRTPKNEVLTRFGFPSSPFSSGTTNSA